MLNLRNAPVQSLLLTVLVALAHPSNALADKLNLALGAHLSGSSWRTEKLITVNKDDLPQYAADQNKQTGWRPDEKAEGNQWLRLDFTRPWPMTYRWSKLVTHWDQAPQSYRWEVSRDGFHWEKLTGRSPSSETDEANVNGSGSYLRLVVPQATTSRLIEVEAYSTSGGSGRLNLPVVSFARNLATVDWSGGTEENVFLYRLTRSASLQVEGAGNASTTALIAEIPATQSLDRVEFPGLNGLPLIFNWTVEAFAPNGEHIGSSQSSESYDVQIRSPQPFAVRGVVEGYYGPLYSPSERENLVRFVGNHGGNFYLYGPKLDPYHREKWRLPYPDDFVATFGQLAETGLQHGVRVAYALSPGLDYTGSAADRTAAIEKLKAFHKVGIRWFGLFMDDIPIAADVTAANQQVELANLILTELRALDSKTYLFFVPTVYAGQISTFTAAQLRYLTALKNLDSDIVVLWTGPGVFSPTITHAQVDSVAVLMNHPLIIWDNYPVADFFLGRRMHLGPVRGRETSLGDTINGNRYVGGYLANPMWMAPANRIPLATVMDYVRDPVHYNPAASLRAALRNEIPPESLAVFEIWTQAFVPNDLIGITESATTRTIDEARGALARGRQPAKQFLSHAAAYYIAEVKLETLYNQDLAGELLPLARKTAALGEGELLSWQLTNAPLEDRSARIGPLLTQAAASPWIVNEGLDELYLKEYQQAVTSVLLKGPELKGRLPARIAIGEPLRVRFAIGDATDVTMVGLTDSSLSTNGTLTWTPRHTGKERWALIASNANGSSVLYGEVAVTEQSSATSAGCATGGNSAGGRQSWLWVIAALFGLRRGPFSRKRSH